MRVKVSPELIARIGRRLVRIANLPSRAETYLTEDGPELCFSSADEAFSFLSAAARGFDACFPAIPIVCYSRQFDRIADVAAFSISEDGKCVRLIKSPDKLAAIYASLYKLFAPQEEESG